MTMQDFSKSWHSMNICTAVHDSACITVQTLLLQIFFVPYGRHSFFLTHNAA